MENAKATPKRSPLLIVGGIVIGLCVLCGIGFGGLSVIGSRLPTLTPAPTNTPQATPLPTNTPLPSETPLPTNTPLPTATATQPPAPISLQGNGDSVVDLNKWSGPAIVSISHTGSGNFAVWNDDASGNHIDLIVNTIGSHRGTYPLDFLKDEDTKRFEIKADGSWQIIVKPLASIRTAPIPNQFAGDGPDVITFIGGKPDLLKIDASTAQGNFALWTFTDSRDLVVNEIAPYTGTVAIDPNTIIIVIQADGHWSIEVTTK